MILPSDAEVARSWADRRDSFYSLPEFIVKFLREIEPILPEGVGVHTWTLNRALSVTMGDSHLLTLPYDLIEDRPEMALERVWASIIERSKCP
jgi:hypothetical protein